MSMIYECPSCHTPQAAGRTSCPQCGADFEGPVPDDAVVPEPAQAAATTTEADAVTETEAPALPDVETTPPSTPPAPPPQAPAFQPPPPPPMPTYQPPPAYAPPAYQTAPSGLTFGGKLPRALLIGIPIVLVLVLGAVFFTRNLDQGSDASSAPLPPVSAPAPAPSAPLPAPTPISPPITLSGGGTSSGDNSGPAKFLVGRWQAKSSDFYVFNDNSTGSRGSISGKQPKSVFVWVLAQNQLTLYTDNKPEKLVYSPGADDDSMFLRGEDGRYVEYKRTKVNA